MATSPLRPRAGGLALFTMLGVAGCIAPLGTEPPSAPDTPPGADVAAPVVRHLLAYAVTSASASSSQANFGPARAIDGNLSTEWASGGYKAPEATLTLDLGASRSVSGVHVKMAPMNGTGHYVVEVSTDGTSYKTASGSLKNTTWNSEAKTLTAPTSARWVRLRFTGDPSNLEAHVSVFEVSVDGGTSTPAPSSAPSSAPSAMPSATASATPMPTGSPSPGTVPVVLPANPGPSAARGRVLVNGAPVAGIAVQLLLNGSNVRNLTTDASGYFNATGLAAGSYQGYYYNASDRNKIGYWRSRPQKVDGTTGAAFPVVDFYQVGMTNTPPMDAHVTLPYTFKWVRQTQPVRYCWFRVHDRPFTAFTLVYKSPQLAGDTSQYTWNGAGVTLSPTNRYFWGFQWDAGPVGEGGNLYQAVYFNH